MTKIKGTFKRKIFANYDTGYTVGLLKIKESNNEKFKNDEVITIVGYFHEIESESDYIIEGDIITHEKYGEQLNVSMYQKQLPEEKDSIVEFLSSETFKGIGEKTAKKIVETLGNDALNIILNYPDNLLLIPTITKKQIDTLHNKLVEYQSSYQTIIKLNELGFSTKDSLLIYNKYKNRVFDIIEEDIYKLYLDIDKITLKKVDQIALNKGIDKLDLKRIKAYIIYSFQEVVNVIGDCYLNYDELYMYTIRAISIKIEDELFNTCLKELIRDINIINNGDKYYLRNIYEAENLIVNRIVSLTNKKENNIDNLDYYLDGIEKTYNIKYNLEQKSAIKEALTKNFLVITGGPGTGKTTIIQGIVNIYKEIHKLTMSEVLEKLALLAPTGRASKRLSESTLYRASTIHRFLKWNKDNNSFQINEKNKSDIEFAIIDEASMIDVLLLDNLLKGLKTDCKIILVGDNNQLPSVGPGQVLKDIIESNTTNIIKLNEIYRQSDDSNIINLAYDINSNNIDMNIFNKKDCIFIPCMSTKVKDNILDISKYYIDYDYRNFQILTPIYRGINGIDEINKNMQNLFNPKTPKKNEIIINGITYREDDKVIQLTNMPDDNVFNGDIGIIDKIITNPKKKIQIDFDGNLVIYNPSDFSNFKHAYSISVHKSQGSEFNCVILPLVKEYGKMLYRKIVYTAVTRAKEKLYLIGDIDALYHACANNEVDIRKTTIKDKLIEKI